ncbi:MAG: hypothetical protein AABX07_01005 [Nanoarchaeota archaeon]
MIVKILGAVDIASAIAFLMLVFGMHPYLQFTLFCAGLLLLKGMFVFAGDILSVIDVISSIFLILSIFLTLPSALLWAPAFILLAKGFVSFL